jgi:hypothetical protein
MRGLKLGPNVVVSFTRPEAWRVGGRYADIPRRAALLRDLVLRRRRDYPNVVSVLLRSMFLASARLPRSGAPGDLFVIPDVPDGVALLDWHKGRDIAALAYRQMTELLESGPEAQAFMASLR